MPVNALRHVREIASEAWTSRGSLPQGTRREAEGAAIDDFRVRIQSQADVAAARERGRTLARVIGLTSVEQALVTGAISELARNMLAYAQTGEIRIRVADNGRSNGVTIMAQDEGPGIADPDRAIVDGFSTSGRLGLGLPGVRRLMDEFDLRSDAGQGTLVTVTKWSSAGRHPAA
jgi:serine/threonine-protein kinase RsbT